MSKQNDIIVPGGGRHGGRSPGAVDRVASACIYRISTGAWRSGQRLPSSREGARTWSVSPLTVKRAYDRLIEMGLVVSAERSGYFVKADDSIDQMSREAPELEALRERVMALIREGTDRQPQGVLQQMLNMETERNRRAPTCAFAECTDFESQMLANEITKRLNIPCLAVTIDRLDAMPPSVKVLLTTAFHIDEVTAFAAASGRDVANVPVEHAPDSGARLAKIADEVLVLSLSEEQAALVAEDLRRPLATDSAPTFSAAQSAPASIDTDLRAWLGDPEAPHSDRAVVLSTTLWSNLPEVWHGCRAVFPYQCRVCAPAWPDVAAALKIPPGGW